MLEHLTAFPSTPYRNHRRHLLYGFRREKPYARILFRLSSKPSTQISPHSHSRLLGLGGHRSKHAVIMVLHQINRQPQIHPYRTKTLQRLPSDTIMSVGIEPRSGTGISRCHQRTYPPMAIRFHPGHLRSTCPRASQRSRSDTRGPLAVVT